MHFSTQLNKKEITPIACKGDGADGVCANEINGGDKSNAGQSLKRLPRKMKRGFGKPCWSAVIIGHGEREGE